jgi:hypothetical protein
MVSLDPYAAASPTILNPCKNSFFPLLLASALSLFTNHSISGMTFAQPPDLLLPFFSSLTVLPSFFQATTSGDSAVKGDCEVRPKPRWSKAVMWRDEGEAARRLKN